LSCRLTFTIFLIERENKKIPGRTGGNRKPLRGKGNPLGFEDFFFQERPDISEEGFID